MRVAADFRRIARNGLRGKWGLAVITGLLAALLGGTQLGSPEFQLELEGGHAQFSLDLAGQTIFSTGGTADSAVGAFLAGSAGVIILLAIVSALLFFVLGSVVETGYARFNLALIDHQTPSIGQLFSDFHRWSTLVVSRLLRSLYMLLWTLLLIIPGIMAAYSYAMTPYILAENPQMQASEAIACSKEMMRGNRWRLFCLQFSFIGWSILSSITLGIGNLWLTPYRQAAEAAFYRDLTGRSAAYDPQEPWA